MLKTEPAKAIKYVVPVQNSYVKFGKHLWLTYLEVNPAILALLYIAGLWLPVVVEARTSRDRSAARGRALISGHCVVEGLSQTAVAGGVRIWFSSGRMTGNIHVGPDEFIQVEILVEIHVRVVIA